MIDPRAIIDPSARLGADVEIGPWTTIGPDVEIGDGCVIGAHVVVKGPTRLGAENRIFQFSSIGEDTPAFAFDGARTELVVGDRNTIREGVTIHRGMLKGGCTRIGDDNLLMAYVHVGHDCQIGDHVVMANNASLSGHVKVGDWANFGGYAGVAQYRAIGPYTHIGAMSLVLKDVPAFVMAGGHPARAIGLNVEGMRRRGFDSAVFAALKHAYRVVYRSGLTAREAVAELRAQADSCEYTRLFVESVSHSQWGIVRGRGQGRERTAGDTPG